MRRKWERVVFVGCGGIGGWLIPPALKELQARQIPDLDVVFCDGDHVEEKNLLRQNFGASEVGFSKVDTCVWGVEDWWHGDIRPINEYVGEDNVGEIVTERSIVLAGPDNHPCRRILAERCAELAYCALILGGNEEHDGNASCHVRLAGKDKTLPYRDRHPEVWEPSDQDRAAMSCAALSNLEGGGQTLAANFMCAALMLAHLQKVLDGKHLMSDIYFDVRAGKAGGV